MITPTQFLEKAAELGRIPHALLFYGSDNQEKMSAALKFAKMLNWPQAIGGGMGPDLTIIEPAEDKDEIAISQIRELQSKLSLKSYSAPFKIAIINRAHYLNQEAQSAFLKMLEEPRGQTLFILITEYPEQLLPTILSRVERLRFCSQAKKNFSEEDMAMIAKISNGDLTKRFEFAKELADDPQNLKITLEKWLNCYREILLANPNQPKIVNMLKNFQSMHHLISTTNVSHRLAMEILMLEVPRL